MLNPSIDELLKNVNSSRFTLCVAAAKRAHQLDRGAEQLNEKDVAERNIGIALEEILEGKVEIDDIYGYSEMQFATEYRVGACGSPAADLEGVDVYFSNPQGNDVLLKCLLIDNENNTVGESGLIKPGCYVKRIKFNNPKSPGTYEMTMKILGFEPETYYSKGIVNLKTYVIIN